jgi:CRISPR-associated protein Cas1
MPDRVLDLSRDPCRLALDGSLLVVRRDSKPDIRVRLDEIAAICVSQPASSASFRALGALAGAGAIVVVCDERHSPTGMLLPLANHHAQTPRFAAQAALGTVARKRLWRQVVRAKIRQQAVVLDKAGFDGAPLRAMMARVLSGDTSNMEAQAAVVYWRTLMGPEFRRDRDQPGINALLNYGYAILRSAMTRAICAAGLHPTLGLQHHHRENPFCLSDDLIEPYRPLVDLAVLQHWRGGTSMELVSEVKASLVGSVCGRVSIKDEQRTMFELCSRSARSLVGVAMKERRALFLPEWTPRAPA